MSLYLFEVVLHPVQMQ